MNKIFCVVPPFREDRRVAREEEQAPLLFSGGDMGDAPLVQEPIGEVNPRRTDNTTTKWKQEENHNKTEQIPVVEEQKNTGIRKNALRKSMERSGHSGYVQ